ncbi:hypothetical protein GCM10011492_22710 [Flexivirga endophytica]|uniref:HTH tetR-type domain-containing protein n=1 Tax=Flexivirga endophytica TaxID=1849103 RepID=A0A916T6B8_9MICO|nr:TetR/AcrR family transcriptional regulator [Flexivirga endophytica]GGB31536.1 hypothetical protein GCM10011492_22710 [Flexivirga endophytica]GHB52468.1 hypothetical protein GCM10008112_21980 [Flexivirga endophytica]
MAPGTHAPGPRAGRAQQVKDQILAVSATHFRRYGYDRTSLAEVGGELGLTRGAVLYHFRSKQQLIAELLRPFTTGLEDALDEFEAHPPAPEAVIDAVLGLLIETRSAVDLLARDIASRHALDLDAWFTSTVIRIVRLLAPGSDHDLAAEVRGYAVLGCLIRPLAQLDGPVDPVARQAIRDAALGALGRSRRR